MQLFLEDQLIFYRAWRAERPKAVVIIAHGLGEHSGRYEKLGQYLSDAGFHCYAIDHRGHGQSDGIRGHITSFTDFSQDLNGLIDALKQQHPQLPVHLLGHSMGGLIVCAYSIRYLADSKIHSLILTSPALRSKIETPYFKLVIARLLRHCLPKMTIPSGLDPQAISRSADVVQHYMNDELVHDRVSLNFYFEYLAEAEFVRRQINKLQLPCLALLAAEDQLVDTPTSLQLLGQLPHQQSRLICYEDAYHEVLNEIVEGPLAFAEISQWLDAQSPLKSHAREANC